MFPTGPWQYKFTLPLKEDNLSITVMVVPKCQKFRDTVYEESFEGGNFAVGIEMTVHEKMFTVAAFNNECLWLINYSS